MGCGIAGLLGQPLNRDAPPSAGRDIFLTFQRLESGRGKARELEYIVYRIENALGSNQLNATSSPYHKFCRTLQLNVPIDLDNVEAAFKNGILELVLPKAEAVKPKQIKVKTK